MMTEQEWGRHLRIEATRAKLRNSWHAGLRYVIAFLFIAVCVGAWAFIASCLWAWFVVPLGVRQIILPEAIGLAMLAWLFREGAFGDVHVVTANDARRQAVGVAGVWIMGALVHFIALAW